MEQYERSTPLLEGWGTSALALSSPLEDGCRDSPHPLQKTRPKAAVAVMPGGEQREPVCHTAVRNLPPPPLPRPRNESHAAAAPAMHPPASGARLMCLTPPGRAEIRACHGASTPAPSLPGDQHRVSCATTHSPENHARFVMHQRENTKELTSCAGLCGDCLRFVQEGHNTPRSPPEQNSVFSMPL